jgi:hypothetical protein
MLKYDHHHRSYHSCLSGGFKRQVKGEQTVLALTQSFSEHRLENKCNVAFYCEVRITQIHWTLAI